MGNLYMKTIRKFYETSLVGIYKLWRKVVVVDKSQIDKVMLQFVGFWNWWPPTLVIIKCFLSKFHISSFTKFEPLLEFQQVSSFSSNATIILNTTIVAKLKLELTIVNPSLLYEYCFSIKVSSYVSA